MNPEPTTLLTGMFHLEQIIYIYIHTRKVVFPCDILCKLW